MSAPAVLPLDAPTRLLIGKLAARDLGIATDDVRPADRCIIHALMQHGLVTRVDHPQFGARFQLSGVGSELADALKGDT